MRQILILALTVIACFGLQSLALRLVGGKTIKSESNFHSSLARIQTSAKVHADVMLLGSSRIARLPEYRGKSLAVSNLGCDGGSAMITLRAIVRGDLPSAPVLVVEGNTLLHDLDHSGSDIADALQGGWFRLGLIFPGVSSTARPSAFAYSALLGKERTLDFERDGPLLSPMASLARSGQAFTLPRAGESLVSELVLLLESLRANGSKVMIVILPPSAPRESLNYSLPSEVSRIGAIPLLDLTEDLPAGSVAYTDGVHMAPASAAAALRNIMAAVDAL